MSDWDEIKRLAADFQRTQTSDTLQRISERNCIDIVKKLTDLNLIELIYTCDGKEFITPEYLTREIEDEIYVNGGRMHLHDLASNLNVDYQHVENKARDLAKDKADEYSVILGQVIHTTYKTTLAKQVGECMLTEGQLSIADFAKSLDLPSEFLLTIVQELLPTVVDDFVVSPDGRTYYSADMMDRYKSIISGTLSAISKPTSVASLMKRLDIPERIFTPTAEGLIKDGRIEGSIENRIFSPASYAREQNEYITEFYSSNSYIEYDVLSRMDIKQPKTYLRKKFPDGLQLKTCFISPDLYSQVEALLEDCVASNSWIDIATMIPSAIESDDIELLIQEIFKKNKQLNSTCFISNQTYVCSSGYIATTKSCLSSMMNSRAKDHLNQGKLISYFMGGKVKETNPVQAPVDPAHQEDSKEVPELKEKTKLVENTKDVELEDDEDEEDSRHPNKAKREKKAAQSREIKNKAVKKKYVPGMKGGQKNNEITDETKAPRSNKGRAARRAISPERGRQTSAPIIQKEPLIFMDTEEIIKKLGNEASEEFYRVIADLIEDDLNKTYETVARETLDEYLKEQAEDEDGINKQ